MADLDLLLPNTPVAARPATAPPEAERALALVTQHFDFVWRLLCRLGLPDADADDAAQQVFIVATQRLAEISNGSERTFLYGTALRTAATLRRNQARRARWVEAKPADAASLEPLPDEEFERREALAFLDEILRRLGDELREVFVLCEIEELSAREVAAICGIPTGTVASRLRRARRDFTLYVRKLQSERTRKK
jgi:RNA polymerase sigma-70 factor, ECF subfamily